MTAASRLLLAVAIVAADVVLLVVPVTGLVAAYLILARPPWFRTWVERLYAPSGGGGGGTAAPES